MKVARTGWNGKGMYLFLVDIFEFHTDADIADLGPDVLVHEAIAMKTADGSVCMGWLASQVDMLAEDWTVV